MGLVQRKTNNITEVKNMMIEALKQRITELQDLNRMSEGLIKIMEDFIKQSAASDTTNFELCKLYYDAIKEELGKEEHGELASGWGSMTINETIDEMKRGIDIIEKRWENNDE